MKKYCNKHKEWCQRMNNLIILFKVNYISWAGLGMAHESNISPCSRETTGIIDIWQEAASETKLQ